MDSVHSRLSTANVAVGAFTGNLAAMLVKAATGFAGDLFSSTIKSAASMNETVSKVKTVFGDAADSVIGQSNQMAKAFGLPKQEMLDSQAVLGLFAKGAGQSAEQAANFSNKMVKLAADASSFNEVPFEQAIQKIQSGLSGESEPLRAFGVFLTEDAVKAEALAMGLIKTNAEMTEGTKVMARASLITKGLATQSGDLDRTASGTANQMKKFWGTLTNLGTDIGTILLPAFDKLLEVGNAAVTRLSAEWESSKATFASWTSSIVEAFDTVGVMWRNLGDVWEIGRIKLAESVANMFAIIETLPTNIGEIASYIGRNWYQLIADGVNASIAVFTNFFTNLTNAGGALGKFFADPTAGFEFNWTPLLDGFKATAEALPTLTKPGLVSYQEQIDAVGKRIADKEQARAAKLAASAAKAASPAIAASEAAAKKAENFKSESLGAADFASKLRTAQLEGAGNVPQQQLEEQKKTREATEKVVEEVKKKAVMVLG